jgi:hypothetical protein
MVRLFAIASALAVLSGCGLGETAVSAAAGSNAEVQQAQQAQAIEKNVQQQLDAAAKTAAAQRQAAESSAQ